MEAELEVSGKAVGGALKFSFLISIQQFGPLGPNFHKSL